MKWTHGLDGLIDVEVVHPTIATPASLVSFPVFRYNYSTVVSSFSDNQLANITGRRLSMLGSFSCIQVVIFF